MLPLHERQEILNRLNSLLDNWPNYKRKLNINEVISNLSEEQVDEIDKLGRIINFWEKSSKVSYENINPKLVRWVNEHSRRTCKSQSQPCKDRGIWQTLYRNCSYCDEFIYDPKVNT